MKIKEGDKIPNSEFYYLDETGAAKKISTSVCQKIMLHSKNEHKKEKSVSNDLIRKKKSVSNDLIRKKKFSQFKSKNVPFSPKMDISVNFSL